MLSCASACAKADSSSANNRMTGPSVFIASVLLLGLQFASAAWVPTRCARPLLNPHQCSRCVRVGLSLDLVDAWPTTSDLRSQQGSNAQNNRLVLKITALSNH